MLEQKKAVANKCNTETDSQDPPDYSYYPHQRGGLLKLYLNYFQLY